MFFLKRWNTLRNQILIVYLIVMLLVLITVGILTYKQVSVMLRNNAEEQIKQTVIEASGRFDSLFEQLNMSTKQVSSNTDLQDVLLSELRGELVSFNERQELIRITNRLQANADGIYNLELYNRDFEKVIPLSVETVNDQIDRRWLRQADIAKGSLVWIGEDPNNETFFITVRRVNLMDNYFERGGYLLIRINKNYLQLNDQSSTQENYMVLTDEKNQIITSNFNEENIDEILQVSRNTIEIDRENYMVVKHKSNITNWTVTMLTPVNKLTNGITVLQTVILVSGLVGFFIFFICSYFLSTFITRPIIKLTQTMRKASEGKLTLNPQIITSNEINELNITYNQLAEEMNYLIQMVYEKELIKSKTELKALQAQINPHFLFNTLDAMYWSLEKKEEDELAELVISMSELFRYTITHQNEGEWVFIKDEVAHVERYMKIMQMRFGNKLSCSYNVAPNLTEVRIPKLIIQPLIENAVLHGIGNKATNGTVKLTIKQIAKQDIIQIIIEDDGIGMNAETINRIYNAMNEQKMSTLKGNSMAIVNVQRRLQLYYDPDNVKGLKIQSELSIGTSITFEIPMIKDDK
ncbi:sensor histidine kinase [Paraliobacillus sediminis]|uniref:sensor histidine kinase n=1 Tax=Paraliobacillus sediminis TaxID=1885916 RepID=UPI000E3C28DF|nr:sensor histidine kinase [Paraliobacillus sediminis]